MICNINIANIEFNIRKAKSLVNVPVSLMFKDFYEFILPEIDNSVLASAGDIYATQAEGAICFSIGKYGSYHKGGLVISKRDAAKVLEMCKGVILIPIDAGDNREGLSVKAANDIAGYVRERSRKVSVRAMITSGCLNDKHPSFARMDNIFNALKGFDGVSLGGSFWLSYGVLPEYVTDVRIGEYMLLGTIPYTSDRSKSGRNGIEIETKVCGVFPERDQFIVDCGYSLADLNSCSPSKDFEYKFVDSSSEYTIFQGDVSRVKTGDTFTFMPNYKSLVKLRNAEHRFIAP